MKDEPIIVERSYNAPIALVWNAITSKEEMSKWYFDLADFKPEVGFEFQFSGGTPEKQYLHRCKITEVNAGRKITYSWRYDGYEGKSFVTFELFADGGKTRIKLTHVGIESFPKDDPNFARKSFTEGWTSIIGTSLKDFVESNR